MTTQSRDGLMGMDMTRTIIGMDYSVDDWSTEILMRRHVNGDVEILEIHRFKRTIEGASVPSALTKDSTHEE